MIFCGSFASITKTLHKRKLPKKHFLIISVLILSLVCTSFCVASLVYLMTVIHASLSQLHECVFNDADRICSCYGPNKKLFKFAENMGCGAVKDKLKELACGVSVLFGVGCLISMATAVSAGFLLCKEKRLNRTRLRLRKAQINIRSSTVVNANANSPTPEEESTFSGQQQQQQQRRREHQVQAPNHQGQAPRRKIKNKRKENRNNTELKEARTTTISSVATQTPSFMMPVSTIDIYDVINPVDDVREIRDEDSYSEFSLELMNNPPLSPPSYSEAIKILKETKWADG